MKKIYAITLIGCDAETCIIKPLTESELEVLKKTSRDSRKVSTYGCMPVMTVEEYDPSNSSHSYAVRELREAKKKKREAARERYWNNYRF